ncbi:uncharacterized protein LOC111384542 [Olea europaea var. sylvestris]|uniref:uncharacterized protein LOC111384542 n=1 Tax=Olea europaea var. sylvestris TaxID=158386 RepID=UPI000C1D108E|nr:uncharacterized protein LOC111384542 [Olea europaea var. sylvestris]
MDTTQQIAETLRTAPGRNPPGTKMNRPKQTGPRPCTTTKVGAKRLSLVKGMFFPRRRERDTERLREGHRHQRNRQVQNEAPMHEIDTIFRGPYVGGETRNAKRNYAREAKHPPLTSYIVDSNSRRNQVPPIIFTQEDAEGVHFPHCDALVVRVVIARNGLKRMLVDNGSSVNILFQSAFDKMILDHQLTPTTTPLYGFTGDSITPREKITLALEMRESPQATINFMEFLIVDSRSPYHGVLSRLSLKELETVTSIHHLCMKFSTKNGVETVRGDQRGPGECYLSSIKKVEPRDVHVIIANIVMADVPGDAPTEPEDIDMIDALPNPEVLVIDEIDPRIIEHEPQASPVEELENFSVDPKVAPHRQKRRALNPERYEALKEEVQKLIQNGFIREATCPRWVSNLVLVKKHNDKWRLCIDFTNLNRVCPKDSFPLPRIDQLVDSTVGHKLVNKMFMDLIGKTMEVYADDMLVKSLEAKDHITHLNSTFQILRRYRMRLNPLKCAFGVASGKFLGYMVNQRGIEANLEKIEAL